MVWKGHFNYLFSCLFVASVLLFPSFSSAADITCGHDDDENGSNTACVAGSLDADHDGFTSDGSQGQAGDEDTDPDDTNFRVGVGAVVDAGGGLVKVGKADGTFTTSKAESALTAADIDPRAQGSIRFYAVSASTSAGCGAYASPCDYRCAFNNALSCYVAPNTTNNVNYMLSGTYSSTWSSAPAKMMYADGIAGTSDHPIFWIASPLSGGVTIDSPGTNQSTVTVPIQLTNAADYWIFRGFNVGNGYAGVGVYFNGNDSSEFSYGKIYSVNGCAGSCGNNISGVTINGGNNNVIRANIIKDTFDTAANTNENNTGTVIFSGTGNKILFNSYFNTSTTSEVGVKNKHGQAAAVLDVIGNHIKNYRRAGIGWNTGGATIKHNYIEAAAADTGQFFCFSQFDWGGTPYWDSVSVVQYNTCVNGGFYLSVPTGSAGSIANPYIEFENNALIDAATAYAYEDGAHHAVYQLCFYCSDVALAAMSSKFVINNNCAVNTGAVAMKMSVGGDSSLGGPAGTNYSSWADWVLAGYDASSSNVNPTCGSNGACTHVDCTETGMFGNLGAGPTTTTTSTTSVTTTTTTSTVGTTSTLLSVSEAAIGTGRRQKR